MNWIWRVGLAHILIGSTILFGSLHPLRELLDAHELHLAIVGSALQAIQGLGLAFLSQFPQTKWPSLVIALGTACYTLMLYLIIFTGLHPFDPLVPIGGAGMFVGWLMLLVTPRPDKPA